MTTLPSNGDCLIYNDYGAGTGRKVIKHSLPGVWWEEEKGVNVINMGVASANSVKVILTQRGGYKTPEEWQQLTPEEALSGKFYTIREGDRIIESCPDAPKTFGSTQAVDAHFKTLSHAIMSVDTKRLPGGAVHHYEIGCR